MTDSKIEMHFESGSNNTIFNNSRINVAGDFYTTTPPRKPGGGGQQQVARLLGALLGATAGDGSPLMTRQDQWYAVWRVLCEKLGYTQNLSEFARIMDGMGMSGVKPACKYESIKNATNSAPKLYNRPVADWAEFAPQGPAYGRQWRVAEWLLGKLNVE